MLTKIVIDSFHVIGEGCLHSHLKGQVFPEHTDQQELVGLQDPFLHAFLDVLHGHRFLGVIPCQHLLPLILVPLRLKDNLSQCFLVRETQARH